MSETVIVQVRVTVWDGSGDPKGIAREMVEDALASRPAKWTTSTFVSQTDVEVVDA